MPGNHRPARGAVIDEGAGARRLPAQHHLFAGIDHGELAAAERAGRRMEIDIVRHRVGVGIDQRQLDVVALMHHHQRSRHRAVEGHGVERGALVVDHHLLLLDPERELHDLGTLPGGLLVRMHEGRRDQLDLLSGQLEVLGKRWCRQHEDCGGGTEHGGSAGQHRIVPSSEVFYRRQSRPFAARLFALQQRSDELRDPYAMLRRSPMRIGDTTLTVAVAER